MNDCSPGGKKINDNTRSVIPILIGIMLGFLIGKSFPTLSITKVLHWDLFIIYLFAVVLNFLHTHTYISVA